MLERDQPNQSVFVISPVFGLAKATWLSKWNIVAIL
jgi:hypothetical protein